jgi:hypothetical protein
VRPKIDPVIHRIRLSRPLGCKLEAVRRHCPPLVWRTVPMSAESLICSSVLGINQVELAPALSFLSTIRMGGAPAGGMASGAAEGVERRNGACRCSSF